MDLLLKRNQTAGKVVKVAFKLWGKVEFNEEEQALIKRYGFDKAVLILQDQPGLAFGSAVFGLVAAFPLTIALAIPIEILLPHDSRPIMLGIAFVICAIVAGYWRFHNKRETIFVRDLMHGRYFTCESVVELARKEAWLETVSAYLRQVMETAKHWDGTQRLTIEALPKDEARQVILRGL